MENKFLDCDCEAAIMENFNRVSNDVSSILPTLPTDKEKAFVLTCSVDVEGKQVLSWTEKTK